MTAGRPLEGRRVVVTRGLEKADRLPGLLEDAGATVARIPLITPVAVAGGAEIAAAIQRLGRREGRSGARPWLVLTSETAAAMVADAAGAAGLRGVALAVVGPATAAALGTWGFKADLVATGQEAASLAAELAALDVRGTRMLVVAASGGRDVVAPVLRQAGARVEVLEVYRTVMPDGAGDQLRAEFARGPVDAVTFTSGSTVRHFATALPDPPRCAAVCVGPVTAQAARDAGWERVVTADEHTSAGVVAAMIDHLSGAHPLP
ncbi:MAG: uroporphyrinogen-III synthase [Candidatus Dormibacteraeota bacterium]|nr:uroporphyrinogen-III synthase [Candidatus Dormibacteraeota bacterium]